MLLPLDSLVIAPVGQFLSAAVVHLVDALDRRLCGKRAGCPSAPSTHHPVVSAHRSSVSIGGFGLSLGTIAGAVHQVARRGQPELARIVDRIRASPVVHADETGWRQDGANGCVWTFGTPTQRYFLRRGRNKEVVDEALGDGFAGVLVSGFYAACHHYDGPKQRCWVHPCSSQGQALLRDIHDLKALYPKDQKLARWAEKVHQLWSLAKDFTHPQAKQRRLAQGKFERALLARCQPFLEDPQWRFKANSADASKALSRNCLSLWLRLTRQRTTTRPKGACGPW